MPTEHHPLQSAILVLCMLSWFTMAITNWIITTYLDLVRNGDLTMPFEKYRMTRIAMVQNLSIAAAGINVVVALLSIFACIFREYPLVSPAPIVAAISLCAMAAQRYFIRWAFNRNPRRTTS